MPTTREEALETLKALKAAPVFIQSYREKSLPEDLDIFFGPPEEYFGLDDEEQAVYSEGRLIAILDDGNFGVITFFDARTGGLVQKVVEDSDEEPVVFATWQHYLADLMIGIGENTEDDAQVERIAQLLEFRFLPDLMKFLRDAAARGDTPYEELRARYVARVAAGS